MKVKPLEARLEPEVLHELNVALRVKGNNRSPSYGEIAANFDLSESQIRRYHARLKRGESPEGDKVIDAFTKGQLTLLQAEARKMRESIDEGGDATGLFAFITKTEMMGHLAFYIRAYAMTGREPDRMLRFVKEYNALAKHYDRPNWREEKEREENVSHYSVEELIEMEQEQRELADGIAKARKMRETKDFERRYKGSDIAEFEEPEVGSVGEEHGG